MTFTLFWHLRPRPILYFSFHFTSWYFYSKYEKEKKNPNFARNETWALLRQNPNKPHLHLFSFNFFIHKYKCHQNGDLKSCIVVNKCNNHQLVCFFSFFILWKKGPITSENMQNITRNSSAVCKLQASWFYAYKIMEHCCYGTLQSNLLQVIDNKTFAR